jgi:2-aminoethylphosphonate-pyruvate transaminase
LPDHAQAETILRGRLQAPIIVTVRMPADPRFHFETFHDRLARRGSVIYPGKLTVADSFRVGCIGAIGETEMRGAVQAIREVVAEFGVASCAPAVAGREAAAGEPSECGKEASG